MLPENCSKCRGSGVASAWKGGDCAHCGGGGLEPTFTLAEIERAIRAADDQYIGPARLWLNALRAALTKGKT